MPRVVLGRVTLFHPEIFLPDVQLLPHRTESRLEKTQAMRQFEKQGRVKLKYSYREVPVVDSGNERQRFRAMMLRGDTLARVLAEPRIINVRDEPSPKAKWKIEFRKKWPDDKGRLDEAKSQQLLNKIANAVLKIKGLWINPTLNVDKWDNPEWANLVLVALRRPEAGAEAPIRMFFDQERLWIEWEEQL